MARVELEAGGDRCTVDLEAGGRLASLVVGGVERLLPREAADGAPIPDVVAWGSFLMAPWVGRLEHGRLPWQGRIYELPRDFGPHAIHGTVKDRPWVVEQQDGPILRASCPLEDPWPFGGEVRQEVVMASGRLELTAEVVADEREMPVGVGWHPWFARPRQGDARVRLAATGTLVTRDDRIPTGEITALDPVTDLRDGPLLGDRRLDHIYVGLGGPALLVWPDLELRIDWESPVDSVCVHSPPRGLCVEPQTAWPNAPALAADGVSGTGLAVARPGIPLRARTIWSWG